MRAWLQDFEREETAQEIQLVFKDLDAAVHGNHILASEGTPVQLGSTPRTSVTIYRTPYDDDGGLILLPPLILKTSYVLKGLSTRYGFAICFMWPVELSCARLGIARDISVRDLIIRLA